MFVIISLVVFFVVTTTAIKQADGDGHLIGLALFFLYPGIAVIGGLMWIGVYSLAVFFCVMVWISAIYTLLLMLS